MKALEEMFVQSLEEMYVAEKLVAKALPELIAVATCPPLIQAMKSHLAKTESHIEKLEEVFEALGKAPEAHRCAAMAGILGEAEEAASKGELSPGLNAAIVSAGQKITHYELATYGCLQSWAEAIDHDVPAGILGNILDDEKPSYRLLSELAVEKDAELLAAGGA